MSKLSKQYYYSPKGERKINCYKATISKEILNQSEIKENDDIKIKSEQGKIIIEKDEKGK